MRQRLRNCVIVFILGALGAVIWGEGGDDSQQKLAMMQDAPVDTRSTSKLVKDSVLAAKIQERFLSTTSEDNSFRIDEKEGPTQRFAYIEEHFATAGDLSLGAETRYQASLDKLRNNSNAVKDLSDYFFEAAPHEFNRQWLATETLGAIDPVAGLPVFREVLSRVSRQRKVGHGMPSIERMVQYSAVEFTHRAALLGSTEASRLLDAATNHPVVEVAELARRFEN